MCSLPPQHSRHFFVCFILAWPTFRSSARWGQRPSMGRSPLYLPSNSMDSACIQLSETTQERETHFPCVPMVPKRENQESCLPSDVTGRELREGWRAEQEIEKPSRSGTRQEIVWGNARPALTLQVHGTLFLSWRQYRPGYSLFYCFTAEAFIAWDIDLILGLIIVAFLWPNGFLFSLSLGSVHFDAISRLWLPVSCFNNKVTPLIPQCDT